MSSDLGCPMMLGHKVTSRVPQRFDAPPLSAGAVTAERSSTRAASAGDTERSAGAVPGRSDRPPQRLGWTPRCFSRLRQEALAEVGQTTTAFRLSHP
jgi:hypothetical protein